MFRSIVARQMGRLMGEIMVKGDFDVNDYIDPIVEAARRLTPSEPERPSHGSKDGQERPGADDPPSSA